jgi:hypothetical protein
MNEMNWLEKELKSWEPRRPSAGIERKLFPKPANRHDLMRALAWLTPVAACMLLVLATMRLSEATLAAERPGAMEAMILSNQSCAELLAGNYSQPENHIVRASFEWTNPGISGTSIRFMPSTNLSL